MSFEPKKYLQIFDDMRAQSQVVTDFEVGSVARTMYESFAFELALMYEKMRLVYLAAYVDTAQARDLEKVVAILGLKRGLPDYATGMVTFFRDRGNDDLLIPVGTLVATEDTPENPKKVYQTLEEKTLLGSELEIEVKVRAVNRGETEVAVRDSIRVMPRPIPGIKSVINNDEIRFTGKGKETDEELRERAKNTLISAGKASKISLENALLSLPKVRDVRVNERFYKARGKIVFVHGPNSGIDVVIPRATRIVLPLNNSEIVYQTLYLAVLPESETSVELEVEAEALGAMGEIAEIPDNVEWEIQSDVIGNNDLRIDKAASSKAFLQKDFGVIEIFVDGPDFSDSAEYDKISAEVDRVKAAGIFPLIKGVQKVLMQGVFRLELKDGLSISNIERLELEHEVADVIKNFILKLKMGNSLRFTQLISAVIAQDQVENMDEFSISIQKPFRPNLIFPPFDLSHKKIELEENERLDIEQSTIIVASEDKPLPLDLEFKINSGALSDDLNPETISLTSYFKQEFPIGKKVTKSAIEASITNTFPGFESSSLVIKPRPLFQREVFIQDEREPQPTVIPSFVEFVVPGVVFAYENYLDIIGAIRFSLDNPSIEPAQRTTIVQQIHQEVNNYIDEFGRAEKIPLKLLKDRLENLDGVNEVSLEETDFQIEILGQKTDGRLNDLELDVKLKEKARRHHLCVSDSVEVVNIVVSNLSLTIRASGDPLTPQEINQAISERVNIMNSFMSNPEPGQNVSLSDLITQLESPSQGIPIILDTITLTATSTCSEDEDADGNQRIQILTQAEANNLEIHIRSNEQAVFSSIVDSDVTLVID